MVAKKKANEDYREMMKFKDQLAQLKKKGRKLAKVSKDDYDALLKLGDRNVFRPFTIQLVNGKIEWDNQASLVFSNAELVNFLKLRERYKGIVEKAVKDVAASKDADKGVSNEENVGGIDLANTGKNVTIESGDSTPINLNLNIVIDPKTFQGFTFSIIQFAPLVQPLSFMGDEPGKEAGSVPDQLSLHLQAVGTVRQNLIA
jgi:hypothetical protein